jgi:hypothetical protein
LGVRINFVLAELLEVIAVDVAVEDSADVEPPVVVVTALLSEAARLVGWAFGVQAATRAKVAPPTATPTRPRFPAR